MAGVVKILGRQGCPVGELRLAVDKKCHKVLREQATYSIFNIRDKRTGKIKASILGSNKNVLSNVLQDAKKLAKKDDVVVNVENVLWDSMRNRPLSGLYVYRSDAGMKTGFV